MDVAMSYVVYYGLILTAILWVGFDSGRLGVRKGVLGGGLFDMGRVGWVIVTLIAPPIGLIAYAATRPRYVALAKAADQAAVAAWHADPTGRHQLRYWDGSAWTNHISNEGAVGQDPL